MVRCGLPALIGTGATLFALKTSKAAPSKTTFTLQPTVETLPAWLGGGSFLLEQRQADRRAVSPSAAVQSAPQGYGVDNSNNANVYSGAMAMTATPAESTGTLDSIVSVIGSTVLGTPVSAETTTYPSLKITTPASSVQPATSSAPLPSSAPAMTDNQVSVHQLAASSDPIVTSESGPISSDGISSIIIVTPTSIQFLSSNAAQPSSLLASITSDLTPAPVETSRSPDNSGSASNTPSAGSLAQSSNSPGTASPTNNVLIAGGATQSQSPSIQSEATNAPTTDGQISPSAINRIADSSTAAQSSATSQNPITADQSSVPASIRQSTASAGTNTPSVAGSTTTQDASQAASLTQSQPPSASSTSASASSFSSNPESASRSASVVTDSASSSATQSTSGVSSASESITDSSAIKNQAITSSTVSISGSQTPTSSQSGMTGSSSTNTASTASSSTSGTDSSAISSASQTSASRTTQFSSGTVQTLSTSTTQSSSITSSSTTSTIPSRQSLSASATQAQNSTNTISSTSLATATNGTAAGLISPPMSHPALVGAIVGPILGALCVLSAIFGWCVWRRNRQRRRWEQYKQRLEITDETGPPTSRWSRSTITVARDVEADSNEIYEADPDAEIREMDGEGCLAQVEQFFRRLFELEGSHRQPIELEAVENPQELEGDEPGCLTVFQEWVQKVLRMHRQQKFEEIDNIQYMDESRGAVARRSIEKPSMRRRSEKAPIQVTSPTDSSPISPEEDDNRSIDFIEELRNQKKLGPGFKRRAPEDDDEDGRSIARSHMTEMTARTQLTEDRIDPLPRYEA